METLTREQLENALEDMINCLLHVMDDVELVRGILKDSGLSDENLAAIGF